MKILNSGINITRMLVVKTYKLTQRLQEHYSFGSIVNISKPLGVAQLVQFWVFSPIITGSTPLMATYLRQSFATIMIHVLVGCCVSPWD